MDFARGERFHIPLDSDAENHIPATSNPPFNFIGDIKERTPSAPAPPTAPTIKSSATGFPAHKKRTRVSAFKQQRAANAKEDEASKQTARSDERALRSQADTVSSSNGGGFNELERQRIDEENRQRLAEMSPEEIEQERQELFAGLNPALIERLLKRANIDTTGAAYGQEQARPEGLEKPEEQKRATAKPPKKVMFEEPERSAAPAPSTEQPTSTQTQHQDQDQGADRKSSTPQSHPTTDSDTALPSSLPPPPSIHFPRPPQPPELDPNSPTFLTDLHQKYYPDLSHDPSKLAWMSSPTSHSPYSPTADSLSPSDLRFSFTGALLPPSTAASIPVTAGLHHHGDAPDAAGYTIPELARLARSTVPGQRCVAFQTLGRVLFRLGRGEWGDETLLDRAEADGELAWMAAKGGEAEGEDGEGEEGGGGKAELARGLWECVERERVLETLQEEANKESGHLTARSLAQEALWNWRRGGGRLRKAV